VLLALPLPNSQNSIWRKFTAVVENAAPGHATWPGTARRHSTAPSPPPPRLYFLAGVTRRAYFYGLYYFAFLECVLPGVDQRPQSGQCVALAVNYLTTLLDLILEVKKNIKPLTEHLHDIFIGRPFFLIHSFSKRNPSVFSRTNDFLCIIEFPFNQQVYYN